MGLQITIITSVSLVLVAAISAAGSIYAARLNRKVNTIQDKTHQVASQLTTTNGGTIAQKVEQIAEKQEDS